MEHVNENAALGYDNMNAGQTLYVRSPSGRYQAATDSHVLAAARVAAESLISDRADMGNPNAVKHYFQAKLSGMGHEVAAVLYLNSQLKVIRYMEMSHGTLTQASVSAASATCCWAGPLSICLCGVDNASAKWIPASRACADQLRCNSSRVSSFVFCCRV